MVAIPSGNHRNSPFYMHLYGDGTNVYLATLNPAFKGKQRNVERVRALYISLMHGARLCGTGMIQILWRIRNKTMT